MGREFGASVGGLNELDKLFKVLPRRTKNRIIPGALKAGGKPVVDEIKKRLPKDITIKFKDREGEGSGKTFKSKDIKITKEIRGRSGDKYLIIGTKVNEDFVNFPAWIEFGTLAHRDKPLKEPRGKIGQEMADKGMGLTKHPFVRPALIASAKEANMLMGEKIQFEIDNQVDLILKKGKV